MFYSVRNCIIRCKGKQKKLIQHKIWLKKRFFSKKYRFSQKKRGNLHLNRIINRN